MDNPHGFWQQKCHRERKKHLLPGQPPHWYKKADLHTWKNWEVDHEAQSPISEPHTFEGIHRNLRDPDERSKSLRAAAAALTARSSPTALSSVRHPRGLLGGVAAPTPRGASITLRPRVGVPPGITGSAHRNDMSWIQASPTFRSTVPLSLRPDDP
uniref:Uncharacterized protein n=1 Tax=Pyrodinium bahamense TaxID=73915 RepID=A0A7S0A4C8_9DINO